ncbi:hypothetical protein GCM10011514_38090 [Emticicia aquatilis]|uniref:DUF3375 domain-containing protein n=1 Tax=Emticicia aquatilis TaxID=1537369 RepID=A0A917DV46_9BACT|nr:DUF3375 domain-containing protein [Emticicia aquatilis]GGD70391.1 hypothetical protein GCM10011514_38090 [Emticicia aquatilis]
MALDYTDFHQVRNLIETNPSIKLLTRSRDTTALVLSFSFWAFKTKNISRYQKSDLTLLLSDFLHDKEIENPRLPREYIDDWVDQGFYRNTTNPSKSDEYFYDITSDTENTLRWLQELNKSEFVGTESRLLDIFNTLREIATRSSENKETRIEQLRKEIKEKELEIEKIKAGEIEVWDSTKIRETFQLLEEKIGRLTSDFRQVEENFRQIDTKLREEIIATSLSKGKFLDNLFRTIDKQIWEKDQGKSFKAFFDFLMNLKRQEELEELTQQVLQLPDIQIFNSNNNLEYLKFNLIDYSDNIHRVNDSIIRSLRRFIESAFFMQNKQIISKIESVLELAVTLKKKSPTERNFIEIDGKLNYDFVMSRKLFEPPNTTKIKAQILEEGENEGNFDILYQQQFINPEELKANIRFMLREQSVVSFSQIIQAFPIQKGLAEIVCYLNLAKDSEQVQKAYVDENADDLIRYQIKDQWQEIVLPKIIFSK